MNETSSTSSRNPLASNAGVSGINVMLGIWLMISTYAIMGFHNFPAARTNNLIVGILVATFGFIRASDPQHPWWGWFNVVLGVWLIISPFVLGFSSDRVALCHNIIVGVMVAILAWTRSFHSTQTSAP